MPDSMLDYYIESGDQPVAVDREIDNERSEQTSDPDRQRIVGLEDRDPAHLRVCSLPSGRAVTAPLSGIRIIEISALGPAPFAGMMLADAGAEVIRVDRPAEVANGRQRKHDPMGRGKRSIALDLQSPGAQSVLHRLVEDSDGLIEGFRPGVAERLGIGPSECQAINQRLVYGRMTGWGQSGPLSASAGHDINYIAVAGLLGHIGRVGERPVPPLNIAGDFGGGGMLLAFGMVAGILSARATGIGQVIDAAMVDGSALLMTMIHGFVGDGSWVDQRGMNLLDTGAPFYEVYETSDGHHMAVGAIERKFYAEFVRLIGLDASVLPDQHDRMQWPVMKNCFAQQFKSRTRAEWTAIFEGSDACVSPVLSIAEAPRHPHNAARKTFVSVDGLSQPGRAPRFGSMPEQAPAGSPTTGQDTYDVLSELGFSSNEVHALQITGAVAQAHRPQTAATRT